MMLKLWIDGAAMLLFPTFPFPPFLFLFLLFFPQFLKVVLKRFHSNSYHVFDHLPVDAFLGHIPAYTKY